MHDLPSAPFPLVTVGDPHPSLHRQMIPFLPYGAEKPVGKSRSPLTMTLRFRLSVLKESWKQGRHAAKFLCQFYPFEALPP